MKRKHQPSANTRPARWYRGADIPMRVIRRYARRVAERFEPEKIILFGSYAYGTPHADSDVDILVVMPARNELDQAFKIRCEVSTQFPMDLLVRKPKDIERRLREGDLFHTKIVTKGKLLYEKKHGRVGGQGRKGHEAPGHIRTALGRQGARRLPKPPWCPGSDPAPEAALTGGPPGLRRLSLGDTTASSAARPPAEPL
jgi:predicted nucleotidyltransferase